MLNSDDSSAAGRIPLVLNESAVESGILMLYIENNDTLTITVKLPELDEIIQRVILDTKKFPSTVHTLIRDVRNMLKAKSIEELIINEIGFQIGNALNQEENYKLLKNIEARSKHDRL